MALVFLGTLPSINKAPSPPGPLLPSSLPPPYSPPPLLPLHWSPALPPPNSTFANDTTSNTSL
eukprot:CAMPEP_0174746474 /NCGR_PEP_ID=MMETSP1094-20130205/89171_1 /TAXON_ID=156173 /ORGANISM="Chrysochromulina brevifilum, Strain UTEX LB 985" /LENGTH=62 /DNA_ID=CAMNT_0015951189 /DNA_START=56 /DNA_END=241 /DNA_ORIENTATION=-